MFKCLEHFLIFKSVSNARRFKLTLSSGSVGKTGVSDWFSALSRLSFEDRLSFFSFEKETSPDFGLRGTRGILKKEEH